MAATMPASLDSEHQPLGDRHGPANRLVEGTDRSIGGLARWGRAGKHRRAEESAGEAEQGVAW
jgi:hypothetical protein